LNAVVTGAGLKGNGTTANPIKVDTDLSLKTLTVSEGSTLDSVYVTDEFQLNGVIANRNVYTMSECDSRFTGGSGTSGGGGLSVVTHDGTLSGKGTTEDPLGVNFPDVVHDGTLSGKGTTADPLGVDLCYDGISIKGTGTEEDPWMVNQDLELDSLKVEEQITAKRIENVEQTVQIDLVDDPDVSYVGIPGVLVVGSLDPSERAVMIGNGDVTAIGSVGAYAGAFTP
jgi:hypothetical protein